MLQQTLANYLKTNGEIENVSKEAAVKKWNL